MGSRGWYVSLQSESPLLPWTSLSPSFEPEPAPTPSKYAADPNGLALVGSNHKHIGLLHSYPGLNADAILSSGPSRLSSTDREVQLTRLSPDGYLCYLWSFKITSEHDSHFFQPCPVGGYYTMPLNSAWESMIQERFTLGSIRGNLNHFMKTKSRECDEAVRHESFSTYESYSFFWCIHLWQLLAEETKREYPKCVCIQKPTAQILQRYHLG